MALEMSLREFEDMNLYSNRSMEKIISSIINESSNAVLVNMFEDSVILLDHDSGDFYTADYDFNPTTLTLKVENFEEIFLEKEESGFKKVVESFFEDEDASSEELTEAYREDVLGQEKFMNELINEALATKNFDDLVDYSEVRELTEGLAIKNEKFFADYSERLETHPVNEVKFINFKDAVIVSLLESEKLKLVNSTTASKAHDIWKREDFKERFEEASLTFVEDFEAGKDEFISLLEDYPQVFFLDAADRKTLFGKSIIANKLLREERADLQKGLEMLFEDQDIENVRELYLSEAEDSMEDEAPAEEKGEEKGEEKEEKKPAPELSPEQISKLSDELKKVAEKVEDEKLKEKLDGIIGKLDGSVNEGTRPDLIKEAIYILGL